MEQGNTSSLDVKDIKIDDSQSVETNLHDNRSENSRVSCTSSVLLRQRAKAEAARARLQFAEKEAKLKRLKAQIAEEESRATAMAGRKKADVETDLELLTKEEEVAVAEAELNAMYDEVEASKSRSRMSVNSEERIKQYVVEQASLRDQERCAISRDPQLRDVSKSIPTVPLSVSSPTLEPILRTHLDQVGSCASNQHGNYPPEVHSNNFNAQYPHTTAIARELRPDAPSFIPVSEQSIGVQCSDFTRFLLKKDLMFSRLTNFDDRAERYAAWKTSFCTVMAELCVNPSEELDLLVKWLGPESLNHAISLRASNARNPLRGLERIWNRLDERYGSPEMVESALKIKLARFPRLTNKENKRLYELSDILAEIESSKEDHKYKALLSYFDTSSGVIPIVNKLPPGLQGKWTHREMKYKQRHGAAFPPFSVFCDFINEMSTMMNDPSLSYSGDTAQVYQVKERIFPRNSDPRQITTKKTDIMSSWEGSVKEKNQLCPIHQTKHSLNQCRGFKTKMLSDRKRFLRNNNTSEG